MFVRQPSLFSVISRSEIFFKQNENKIRKNQERCLLFVLNEYSINSSELLQSSRPVSAGTKGLCAIAYKFFKTLNDPSPSITKEIFHQSPNLTRRK